MFVLKPRFGGVFLACLMLAYYQSSKTTSGECYDEYSRLYID